MEKGRKNIRPFIITAMVALIALVVGMGGYTFAKYFTSTGTHSNQATVAKWGFVLSANATNLFGEEYRDTEDLAVTGTDTGTVVVSAGNKTLAPGTTGSMTFSVHGTSEVLSKLTITAASTNEVKLELGENDYMPVKWTLTKGSQVVDGCDKTTLANVVEVINHLDDQDQAVAPNASLQCEGDYTLSWEWAFTTDTTNDSYDTVLGQIAQGLVSAAEGTYAGSVVGVNFSITISIEQIQA